jgi:hypothetical protein
LSFKFIYCHTLIFRAKSLSSSIHRWKLFEMRINIVILNENTSFIEKKNSKFEIQEIMLIYFELRTLFDLKNKETSTIRRCSRYLNKTVKIKFELRMLLHLCLKRNMISKNYRDAFISLKREQNLEIYQDVTVSSEESTVNENWLQKVLAIELITIRMMILKQSKKRRALFRRRKFDVLIRFDLAKNLFTKNALHYINRISFFYFFVWAHYFII